jgi:hypothetical protein
MIHLRITIDVAHDEASVEPEAVEHLCRDLEHEVTMAAERGLLTPTYTEIIDEWSVHVDETDGDDD